MPRALEDPFVVVDDGGRHYTLMQSYMTTPPNSPRPIQDEMKVQYRGRTKLADTRCDAELMADQGTEVDIKAKIKPQRYNCYDGAYISTYKVSFKDNSIPQYAHCGAVNATIPALQREYPLQNPEANPGEENLLVGDDYYCHQPKAPFQNRRASFSNQGGALYNGPRGNPFAATLRRYTAYQRPADLTDRGFNKCDQNNRRSQSPRRYNVKPRIPCQRRSQNTLIDYEREDTAVRKYSDHRANYVDELLSAEVQAVSENFSKQMFTSTAAEQPKNIIPLARSSVRSLLNPPQEHTSLLPVTLFRNSQVGDAIPDVRGHDLTSKELFMETMEQGKPKSKNKLQCQILYLLENTPLQPTRNDKDRALRKKVLRQIYQKFRTMSLNKQRTRSEEDFMANIRTHLGSTMRAVNSQRSLRKRYFTRNKGISPASLCARRLKKSRSQGIKPNLEQIILIWFNSLNLKDATQSLSFNSFVDRIRNISDNLLKLKNEYKNCLKEEIIDYLHEIPLNSSAGDIDYLRKEANKLLFDILKFYNYSEQSSSCKYIICFINHSNCTTQTNEKAVKKIIKCDLNDYISEENITQGARNIEDVEQSVTHIVLNSVENINSSSDKEIIDKIQSALVDSQIFSASQSIKLSQIILKHVKDDMPCTIPKKCLPLSRNFKPLDACLVFQETSNDRTIRRKWWKTNDDSKNSDHNSEINITSETKVMVGVIKEWLKKCHFFISHKSRFKGAIRNLAEDIIYRQKYLALHNINANTEHELEYLKFQIFKSLNFIIERKDNDYASELMNRILNSETYKKIQANINHKVREISNINYEEEPPLLTDNEQSKQDLQLDKISNNDLEIKIKDNETDACEEVTNQSFQRISQANCEKLSRLINENHKSDSQIECCEFKASKSSIQYNSLANDQSGRGSCSYNELEVFQLCHPPQRASCCREDVKCVQLSSEHRHNLLKLKTPQQINDELVKFLKEWCEEIPIDVRDNEEKSAAVTARIVIQIGVGKQIVKIRADPLAMKDRYLCQEILGEEVDDLLDCLPQSLELLNARYAAKINLINYVVKSNQQLLEAYVTLSKQHGLNQVPVSSPHQVISNIREKLNDINFIDDYIKQNYLGNDKNIQLLYKKRLTEEIRRILREYRDTGVQRNDEQLEQDIYKGLNSISIPTDDSYHKFAQQMLIKMEIDEWIKTLPIKSTMAPEDKRILDKHVHILAEKLSQLIGNKTGDLDKNISQEISSFFSKLPLLCELAINRDMSINDLINRLKVNINFREPNNVAMSTDFSNFDCSPATNDETSCLRKNNERQKWKSNGVILKKSSLKIATPSDLKKQCSTYVRTSPNAKYIDQPEICYVTKECQSKISVKDHSQNTPRIAVPLLYQEDIRSMSSKDDSGLTSSDALLNYVMTWRHLASTPYQFAMLSIYLITKVSKLHQDPSMLSNDLLYEQIIDSILEEALDRYGMEMDSLEKVGAMSDIGKQLKFVRELVKTEYEVSNFKQEIISTAYKIIHLHNVSKDKRALSQIPEMSAAAEAIADELIEMHYEAQDINQQCKRKLIDMIENYVYEMKINNILVFLCENLVKKAIMKAILEIPAPSKEALATEVKAIKLKQLIDVTFNDLPIASPTSQADKQHLSIMKCILTKKIQAINADVSSKSHEFYYKANTAIVKTLKHIPLRTGEDMRALDYADQMFTRLFETRIPKYVRPLPKRSNSKISYRLPTGSRARGTVGQVDKTNSNSNVDLAIHGNGGKSEVPVFFGTPDSCAEYNGYPRRRFDAGRST